MKSSGSGHKVPDYTSIYDFPIPDYAISSTQKTNWVENEEGYMLLVKASPKLRNMGTEWIRVKPITLLGSNWHLNARYFLDNDPAWDITWMRKTNGDKYGYVEMMDCGQNMLHLEDLKPY